jgi:glutamine synthetase
MHCHLSLFKNGKNLFSDEKTEWQLSKTALQFIGGVIDHAPRASARSRTRWSTATSGSCPATRLRRTSHGAMRNRSPMVRIPERRGLGTRLEVRMPDPSCNPYLAFTAMLAAGLDGIEKQMEPPPPVNKNIYTMSARERSRNKVGRLPGNLSEAVIAFEKDQVIRDTLGEHVFTHFVEAKKQEWSEYIAQVHEWELNRYLGVY